MQSVNGGLYKTKRPANSSSEDIVISVLANQNAQIQEAMVNVNIYVQDILRDKQFEENSIRLRELASLSASVFECLNEKGYRITLEKQSVLEVNGLNEHCINNSLLYQFAKE